ncbi:MAG: site-specific integrase [Gammaproteobacteria bacterium]|nr:MAG: site-specific integrase [Gammaproteobacteria bacterium]
MPRIAKQLSDRAVGAIKQEGRHAVGGVPGLHLKVTAGSRAWVLRVTVADKRRDMGLGSYPAVSLSDARAKARSIQDALQRGELPDTIAHQRRNAIAAAVVEAKTFDWCIGQYLSAKSHEWRNVKHRRQWENTLIQYAGPIIGRLDVSLIELPHVMEVLTAPQSDREGRSLWDSKNETASRLRGRIERVLDWATVSGYRQGLNPARWRGHLDAVLATPSKVQKVEHHRALPFTDVPAFMTDLRQREGIAARALEFVILTAARSGEVRGATWAEIDQKAKIWAIPAERMKAGKAHRVPLSDAAVKLLQAMPRIDGSELIFPGAKGPLSDMSLTAVTRRMGTDCVPHGFRSSFRDWAADARFPREIAELALAHTSTKGAVERAYWRDDALDQRAELMAAWAGYCAGVAGQNVVRLHA